MVKKWKKARVCPKCGHVHERPEEAKTNNKGYYCTWCSTPLVIAASKGVPCS
jgi:predicted RNA-binding Zn-ribbon protein involved in translation (DUF1610 family)